MQNTGYITKCPQFFKAIHVDTLSHGKIEIPKRYVKRYGSELLGSKTVLLKLPDGKNWEMTIKVTVIKSDHSIWIENGWQEFAQYYHLSHGSFLLFQKNGSCSFDVAIFDLSATEIDYPVQKSQMPSSVYVAATANDDDVEEDEDDVSVEVIGGTSNTIQKSQVSSSSKGIINALGRAKAFKSSHPFFKVVMGSSYIRGGRLVVPLGFAKKHGLWSERNACLLVMQRTWQVKYQLYNQMKFPSFSHGWNKFVADNGLKQGDVCLFQLVAHSQSQLKFKVKIYRV